MRSKWVIDVGVIGVLSVALSLGNWGNQAAAADEASGGFEWQTATPQSQGMSSERVEALRKNMEAHKTSGLLIIRNDKIVCEWYAPESSAKHPHFTASMAKALVGGMATAVAITDGLMKLDDKAAQFVPQWQGVPQKSQITIRELGSHTSGIDDAHDGDVPKPQLTGWKYDFWKRYPVPNDPFTISRDKATLVFDPGTGYQYSNPGIAMLGYVLTAAIQNTPCKDLQTLLRDRVMRPIGVPDDEWSIGYGETYVVDGLPLKAPWGGGNYTARATARVGRLMLRKGNWEGKQILSEEAVRDVTIDAGTPNNGAVGWWSNNDGTCKNVPKDAFWGLGAGDQIVFVVPSLRLIAVRNGAAPNFKNAMCDWLFVPLVEAVTEP